MRRFAAAVFVRPERVPFLPGEHVGEPKAWKNDHSIGQSRGTSDERRDSRGCGRDTGGDSKPQRRLALPTFRERVQQPVTPLGKIDEPSIRQNRGPDLVNQLQLFERLLPMACELRRPTHRIAELRRRDLFDEQDVQSARKIGCQAQRLQPNLASPGWRRGEGSARLGRSRVAPARPLSSPARRLLVHRSPDRRPGSAAGATSRFRWPGRRRR